MEMLTYAAGLPYKVVTLDGLTALYHCASAMTRIVAEPVPQILAALASDRLSVAELLSRLADMHDLSADGDQLMALAARLDELAVLGLVDVR